MVQMPEWAHAMGKLDWQTKRVCYGGLNSNQQCGFSAHSKCTCSVPSVVVEPTMHALVQFPNARVSNTP